MNQELGALLKYGLDEKEAKTYLALLELGEITATKVSEKASIDRVLTYQILAKLIDKGLASQVTINYKKHFKAAKPEIFLSNLKEKERILKLALPSLKSRNQIGKKTANVELYKGRKGIYTILKMIITDRKPYYAIGGIEEAYKLMPEENLSLAPLIEEIKLPGKVLVRKNEDFYAIKNEEYRYIPENLMATSTTFITGDKTIIVVWSEPHYAILINNKEITQGYLALFNHLWETAEIPKKKDLQKHLEKPRY